VPENRFVELDTFLLGGEKAETRLYNVAHIVMVYPTETNPEACFMWTTDCEDDAIALDHSYAGVKTRLMPALY
jgi:hypothetical protein